MRTTELKQNAVVPTDVLEYLLARLTVELNDKGGFYEVEFTPESQPLADLQR